MKSFIRSVLDAIILLIAVIFTIISARCTPEAFYGGSENSEIKLPEKKIEAANYILEAINDPKPTLYYDQMYYEYDYNSITGIAKHNCHIGQRKLLLNEIQFLSKYMPKDVQHIILYVGAAPGEHLTIIKKMFPGNKYLLVDPNFCIIDDA